MAKSKCKPAVFLILTAISLVLLSGCIYRSGPRTLETDQPRKENVDARVVRDTLDQSLEKSRDKAGKFWFQGWVSSKVQNRITNLMLNDGMYDRQKGFYVKGSLLRKNFIFYRWEGNSYISDGEGWRLVDSVTWADPFEGFAGLMGAAGQMAKLPDEKVLGQDCTVFQAALKGEAIRKVVPEGAALPGNDITAKYLSESELVYTIWIGKKDNYIYQYKAVLTMPVPGAGMLNQTTYFRFWDYNSRNINLPSPETVGIDKK